MVRLYWVPLQIKVGHSAIRPIFKRAGKPSSPNKMGKSAKNKLRGGKPPTATPVVAVTKAADQAAAIPPPPPPPPPATLAAQTQKITLAEDMTPDQRRQKEHQDNLNALRTLAEGAVQYWRPRMRGRFSRGRSKTKKLSGERKVQYVSAAPQMRGKLSRRGMRL